MARPGCSHRETSSGRSRRNDLPGLTSNPSIFEKAIVGSTDDADGIAELRRCGPLDAKSAYEWLAVTDIRAAGDILRSSTTTAAVPTVTSACRSRGPGRRHGRHRRRRQAAVLQRDRPNPMVKVPASRAGIP